MAKFIISQNLNAREEEGGNKAIFTLLIKGIKGITNLEVHIDAYMTRNFESLTTENIEKEKYVEVDDNLLQEHNITSSRANYPAWKIDIGDQHPANIIKPIFFNNSELVFKKKAIHMNPTLEIKNGAVNLGEIDTNENRADFFDADGERLIIRGEKAEEVAKLVKIQDNYREKRVIIKGINRGLTYFTIVNRRQYLVLESNAFNDVILANPTETTEPPPIPEGTKPKKTTTAPETTETPPPTGTQTPETPLASVYDVFGEQYLENNSVLKECISKYIKEGDEELKRVMFFSLIESGDINEKHLSENRRVIKYGELEETLKKLFPNSQNPPTNSPSGTSESDKLSDARSGVISLINKALNEEPTITENELSSEYHGWEEKIKNLNVRKEITNFFEKMMRAIGVKRKAKKNSQKVNDNVDDMKNKNGEELNEKIKENDENQGTQGYDNKKEEIKTEKERAAQENAENYRNNTALPTIKKWMEENGIGEKELDNDTKTDYEKLKNGEINQPNEIVAKEMKIKESIGVQGAEKKITELEKEVKAVLKSGDKKKIEQLKRKINEFINTDNIYYSTKKSVAAKLLNDLNSYRSTQTNSPNKFPLKVVIPVLLVGGLIITAALVLIRNKKRKQAKVK